MWRILLGLLVGIGIYVWVDITSFDKPDLPGTVKTNLTDLGFGPRKQLLVFEFDVSTIDMSDKKFMTLTWSDIDGSHTMPAGIEIKGSGINERPKLNYAFEIWEPSGDEPCTSVETCDDSKAELFQFGEDYEDYVLRGGYKEPTLIRDTIPSEMEGGILQHTLVEVVFKHEGEYFYEGVYILYPAIQRRVLEKRLGWNVRSFSQSVVTGRICDITVGDIVQSDSMGQLTVEGCSDACGDADGFIWKSNDSDCFCRTGTIEGCETKESVWTQYKLGDAMGKGKKEDCLEDICLTEPVGPNSALGKRGCDSARWSSGDFSYNYCKNVGGDAANMAAAYKEFVTTCCDWSNSTCVAKEKTISDSDISETAFIGEYTNPGPGSRKKDCDWLDMIKMRYPKCDHGSCYHDEIRKYFTVVTGKNKSAVDVDLASFVDTFFVESLMLNGDFPISSQYFYKDPSGVFHSGPRWDYDYMSWRLADAETWDFETTYGSSAAPFWKDLGEHVDFIGMLNAVRESRSDANLAVALAKVAERRAQYEAGYFDRNIERWGGFDSRLVPYSKDMHLRHPDGRVKGNFTEELDFIEHRFKERAAWMKANEIEEFEFRSNMLFPVVTYIQYTYVTWGLLLIGFGGCVYYQSRESEYEKLPVS